MLRQFHQVVYCSERHGQRRAFLREITVGPENAMVTGIEKLPPNYDFFHEKMRDPNEEILEYDGDLNYADGCRECPFCGNRIVFFCNCSTMSCFKSGSKSHYCPGCQRVHGVSYTGTERMSASGFLHDKNTPDHRPAFDNAARRKIPPSSLSRPHLPQIERADPEKTQKRENVRKFLEEKKKFQIEDKRDKKQ